MIKNFDEVVRIAKERGPKRLSVALANDEEVLLAVSNAHKAGIVEAVLVGDEPKMRAIAAEHNIDLSPFEIINEADLQAASAIAVGLVSSGKADIVMKGLVDTSIILKAVLNKETGLRTGSVLSHTAVFDVPSYGKLLFVTDAAMNIAPDVETKAKIIDNTVKLVNALDIENPNVAVVCAKEKVSDKMPATLDAEALVKMNQEGTIKGCVVGGPFALDNAVSKEAAKIKGVTHPGAGEADILLMPTIEAGNILYKSLSILSKTKNAGIILGAKAPVVLTSRADSDETKLYSIALAVLMAAK